MAWELAQTQCWGCGKADSTFVFLIIPGTENRLSSDFSEIMEQRRTTKLC